MVIPFTAGAGIEATEELEKIALMMVKGITEAVEKNGQPFKLLNQDQTQTADFILQGHVVEIGKMKKGLGAWWGKPQPKFLGVEATIVDRKTGKVISRFVTRRESTEMDYRILGRELGREIGQSLIANMD